MFCKVCRRKLKTKESIERGMGPVCAKKLKAMEDEPPKGQMSIYDYLKEGDSYSIVC